MVKVTVGNYFDMTVDERFDFYYNDIPLYGGEGEPMFAKQAWIKWWDEELFNKYELLLGRRRFVNRRRLHYVKQQIQQSM